MSGIPVQLVHADALVARISSLYDSREHADLALICNEGVVIHVHKAIVCPASGVLKAQIDGTNGGQDITLKIEDTDPTTIERIIHYLYKGDYGFPKVEDIWSQQAFARPAIQPPLNLTDNAELVAHARVYVAAKRYAIENLPYFSESKFRAVEGKHRFNKAGFIDVIREVVGNTPRDDRCLRKVVGRMLKLNRWQLERDQTFMDELFKIPGLEFDLMPGMETDRLDDVLKKI